MEKYCISCNKEGHTYSECQTIPFLSLVANSLSAHETFDQLDKYSYETQNYEFLQSHIELQNHRANAWVEAVRKLCREELGIADEDSNGSIKDWNAIVNAVKSINRK